MKFVLLFSQCIATLVTHRIFKRCLNLLTCEQSTRIFFNTLEGNYALCLMGESAAMLQVVDYIFVLSFTYCMLNRFASLKLFYKEYTMLKLYIQRMMWRFHGKCFFFFLHPFFFTLKKIFFFGVLVSCHVQTYKQTSCG